MFAPTMLLGSAVVEIVGIPHSLSAVRALWVRALHCFAQVREKIAPRANKSADALRLLYVLASHRGIFRHRRALRRAHESSIGLGMDFVNTSI